MEIASPHIINKAHNNDHPNIIKETDITIILVILEMFFDLKVFMNAYPAKQRTNNQPQYWKPISPNQRIEFFVSLKRRSNQGIMPIIKAIAVKVIMIAIFLLSARIRHS